MSTEQPKTGPMGFGQDWPGLFVRGEDALKIADYLQMALEERLTPEGYGVLHQHLEALRGCHVRTPGFKGSMVHLKDFSECVNGEADAKDQAD